MIHYRRLSVFLLASALAGVLSSEAAPPSSKPKEPKAKTAAGTHRVTLSAGAGKDLPFTIEVPRDWTMRPQDGYPGFFVGPADAKPPSDPRLIYVRGSQVSLADPDQVAANIRANDAQRTDWEAPRIEVKDVGGVKGLLVRMDTGEGATARSTLTLKLPLGQAAMDLAVSGNRAELDKRLKEYERILLSVRPVAAKKE